METSRLSPPEQVLQRVRAEYDDLPSLRLTPSQAQRQFGLEPRACAALLDTLLNENFLTRTSDGVFVRAGLRISAD